MSPLLFVDNKKRGNMLRLYRTAAVMGVEMAKMATTLHDCKIVLEWCFHIETDRELKQSDHEKLTWLLSESFDRQALALRADLDVAEVIEIGPRPEMETPWSSTARSILDSIEVVGVTRFERSRRYGFSRRLTDEERQRLLLIISDRMTEVVYDPPPETFDPGVEPEPVQHIPLLEEGMAALEEANQRLGLAMDEDDLFYNYELFTSTLSRNPTDVELFQLAQANSEHSRHWFFKGIMELDGVELPPLMQVVSAPLAYSRPNVVVAFHGNTSAIEGSEVMILVPENTTTASRMIPVSVKYHSTLTAETHNHPTTIEEYHGLATGVGGILRDGKAPYRGGVPGMLSCGICTGNPRIPGREMPWEDDGQTPPEHVAPPLNILISGSNGGFDYGNCYGIPTTYGFIEAWGIRTNEGYRANYKCVAYISLVGEVDSRHAQKTEVTKGMKIAVPGGPNYRIGMGGGARSSATVGDVSLDFDSVQRGDPEMGQRGLRLVLACSYMGARNPIKLIHDEGAGGNSNAIPETLDPAGGMLRVSAFPVADTSLSVREIWGNESQERDVIAFDASDAKLIVKICDRENLPIAIVGEVTGDGQLVLIDERDGSKPVNLPLGPILGELPRKRFKLERVEPKLNPLTLPDISVTEALERVFGLVSVASKGWLTRKVDRSVTGLIAQQQCVGPYQLPLSNYAIKAKSRFDNVGTAASLGQRQRLGLISTPAMARMAVAEALTNLMGAVITELGDVKGSLNWMWPDKRPVEAAQLYDAATAFRDFAIGLGIAADGGKDSMSMTIQTDKGPVKAPGQMVFATYALMPDVQIGVTPDLKQSGNSLILIDLSRGQTRLGASCLAQTFGQLGDECPDFDNGDLLKRTFNTVQELIRRGEVVSLHDRSDGGLVTTLVEMAIGGGFGIEVETSGPEALPYYFNEELGLVIEVSRPDEIQKALRAMDIPAEKIGTVGQHQGRVNLVHNNQSVLGATLTTLRRWWEATSDALERQQTNPACVEQEVWSYSDWRIPQYELTFQPLQTPPRILKLGIKPQAAVLRVQGTNGDAEMRDAYYEAGFEVNDIMVGDLLRGEASLGQIQALAYPGGFSFADVLGAGKGWGGMVKFRDRLADELRNFYERQDTLSLGVCNGAQLMTVLGLAPFPDIPEAEQPRLLTNQSERFESRWVTVRIDDSPAIMLEGMSGTVWGIWLSSKEGRVFAPDFGLLAQALGNNLVPMRYVDRSGHPTEDYPYNPNGSPYGAASMCTSDGRHLWMMPHMERSANRLWQMPWTPPELDLAATPWLKPFQNAYHWCKNA
jgi:phosphoribosylformylglycinamidine synthase